MSKVLPPRGYTSRHTEKRRAWLAHRTGFELNQIGPDQPEDLKGIIENHVGFVSVPMAVSGPLLIDGTYANGEFYVPICTLEGTLSMSMTRGFFLTYLSGGITTRHIKQELSRSPMFLFYGIDEALRFEHWISQHFEEIRVAAESTTRHGKLLRIDGYTCSHGVILDFVFSTAEAAGQNMVTIATHRACQFVRERYDRKIRKYYIECNFNGDKNPTTKTVLRGRSHQVLASTLIEGRVLRRIVRATAQEFVDAWRQCIRGAHLAGVVGMNMHVANALAALYLATGQDVACVAENAVGIMDYEVRNGGDLYVAMFMPSLSVGTVGGGTTLNQQRRNLEMLSCTGKDSSKKLAEIFCASALALELSLGGAIVSDEFAQSHVDFGRR